MGAPACIMSHHCFPCVAVFLWTFTGQFVQCCKIGKRKLSVSSVTIHTRFRAPASIDSSDSTWCPTGPRCAHAHSDQLNISCSLKQFWWWHVLWQEIIAKRWLLRTESGCSAQKNKRNRYILNIDSGGFCSGIKIRTNLRELLSNN